MSSRNTHWEHLVALLPDLPKRSILDLGCGKGAFLMQAARAGARIVGLEYSATYREIAHQALAKADLEVLIMAGRAEELPFPNEHFDFINICEVFEHVESPSHMLREAYRVLAPGGYVYVSIPNRFGIHDPHFHLWLVNWLPRRFAGNFITVFGKHKNYADQSAGLQRLTDMHYATHRDAFRLCVARGFVVQDIRLVRIRARVPKILYPFALLVYVPLRALYFDSFHFLLFKK